MGKKSEAEKNEVLMRVNKARLIDSLKNSVITIGIDPGVSGAAVLLIDGKFCDVIDWKDEFYVARMLRIWFDLTGIDFIDCAFIEAVHAQPTFGAKRSFAFGENFGWWKGVLTFNRVKYQTVTPRKWMYNVGVPKKKSESDKPSLPYARRLFPDAPLDLQKHNGRADALLIAFWGYRTIVGEREAFANTLI